MSYDPLEIYGPEIDVTEAVNLFVGAGGPHGLIDEIRQHPAVDEFTFEDGSVLRHWHGGDEHDCQWTWKQANALEGSDHA